MDTMLRTPFRDLNGRQSVQCSEKRPRRSVSAVAISRKVRYSEITPVKQTHIDIENISLASAAKRLPVVPPMNNAVSMPELNVKLNALVYQTAMDMIKAEKQSYDSGMQQKSKCIQELEEMFLNTTSEKDRRIAELQEMLLTSSETQRCVKCEETALQMNYKREYERVLAQLSHAEEQLMAFAGLQTQLNTTRELQNKLHQQLKAARVRIVQRESDLEQKSQEVNKQSREVLERQKLDQMVQRTLAENSRLRQAVHESERKHAELQEADTQLRHELDEKTAEVTSLKFQAVESAALVANVDSLISERDALVASLQSSLKDCQQALDSRCAEITRLSAEGSNLQLTIDRLQSNVDELTRAKDDLVTTLSSQRIDAEKEINDLKEKVQLSDADKEFAELELATTMQELVDTKKNLERTKQDYEDVTLMADTYRSEREQLERELADLTSDLGEGIVNVNQLLDKLRLCQSDVGGWTDDTRITTSTTSLSSEASIAVDCDKAFIEHSSSLSHSSANTSLSDSFVVHTVVDEEDKEPISEAKEECGCDAREVSLATCDDHDRPAGDMSIVAAVMEARKQQQIKVKDRRARGRQTASSIVWERLRQSLKEAQTRCNELHCSVIGASHTAGSLRERYETHIQQLEEQVTVLTKAVNEKKCHETDMREELRYRQDNDWRQQETIAALLKRLADCDNALIDKDKQLDALHKLRADKEELERKLEIAASDMAAVERRASLMERERRVIEEELAGLFSAAQHELRDTHAVEDRLRLKKANLQLEHDLFACQQAISDIKLQHKLKLDVLDRSWKRAEDEVQKLNNLLKHVTRMLLPHRDMVLSACPYLLTLLPELLSTDNWSRHHDENTVTNTTQHEPSTFASFSALRTPCKRISYGLTPTRNALGVTPLKNKTPSRWTSASKSLSMPDLQEIDWIISKLDEIIESRKADDKDSGGAASAAGHP